MPLFFTGKALLEKLGHHQSPSQQECDKFWETKRILRPPIKMACARYSEVSIHAPAGGATYRLSNGRHPQYVSIHAPAGGATF